jgi:oligopeptide transport system ATP-binding protein
MDRSGSEKGARILMSDQVLNDNVQFERKTLLQVDDLSVTFRTERGQVRAVDGVSLHVKEGETLAIVGESGSGKSVTALSILQLLGDAGRIDRGRVIFEGTDLVQLSSADIRKIRGDRIAMIFQEPMSSLNPVLTIGKQVAEPIWLHRKMSWKDAFVKAGELLEKVAIPDAKARLDDYPHQFSGGMSQRVMIAMALACEPKLIIADEPTTALDVTVQAQILSLLKNLTQETNSSLILITHDLGVVARYADRVAVMYGGRVVETASARDLYKKPQHPYTEGLMASVPTLDGVPGARLQTISGQPPDLANLPEGCAFSPRCPYVRPECKSSKPALLEVGHNHLRACFGYDH